MSRSHAGAMPFTFRFAEKKPKNPNFAILKSTARNAKYEMRFSVPHYAV